MHIKNEKHFFDFLGQYAKPQATRIFRGVSSDKHKLIPSIGRKKSAFDKRLLQKDEKLIFQHFKQRSKRYLSKDYDDKNLLAIAQHHGLPTRLLDWTFNPLAAAYFAVEHELHETNIKDLKIQCSIIYIFEKDFNIVLNKSFSIFDNSKVRFFIPDYIDDRIINQNGLFTVHPYPWDELKSDKIHAVTIDISFRRTLRKILNRLGVNESTIYPDIDGMAKHINWMRTFDY